MSETNVGEGSAVHKAKQALKQYFSGISRYHALVFVGCWLGGIFDGMDSTLMSVVLPSALKELLHSTDQGLLSQVGSWITAIFLLGWTLGGALIGYLGDRWGRVKAILFSILLYAVFTGLASFAATWEQLAICRFLTGLGIGGELVSIATFLTEVWPERSRAMAIGVLITSYSAGVFLAGSLHYFVHDWRTVFLIGALPALMVIVLRMGLKESDKWVSDQEKLKSQEGEATVWQTLLAPENQKMLWVGTFGFAGLLIGYWASLSWIPTWIQSIIVSGDGTHERSLAVMIQGIGAILGCTSAGYCCETLGRKPTLVLGYLCCFLMSWLLFMTNPVFTPAIYGQTGLLGFFIGLVQSSMYIYLPELFRTRIRATATGFCLNSGRVLTVMAVLNLGLFVTLLDGYGQAAFAFAFSYLLGCVGMAFGPETKNRPLLT